MQCCKASVYHKLFPFIVPALSTKMFPINIVVFPLRVLFPFEKSAFRVLSAVHFTRTGTNNIHALLDTHTHKQLSGGRRKQAGSFQHGAAGRKRTRRQRQAMPSSGRMFWNRVLRLLQSPSPLGQTMENMAFTKHRLLQSPVLPEEDTYYNRCQIMRYRGMPWPHMQHCCYEPYRKFVEI